MARPKQYPNAHYIRISDETQQQLIKRAKIMGLKPAVCLRIIVEHSLSGEPIKEAKNVRNSQKNG